MRLKSWQSNLAIIVVCSIVALFASGLRVRTQAPFLVFGSSSGTAQIINATTNALWVSVQQVAIPADGKITFQNAAGTHGITAQFTGAPTISSNFGTSPSVTSGSTDSVGEINVGTGGAATAGIINFASTWPNAIAPKCISAVNGSAGTDARVMEVTTTTTQAQFTASAAWASGTIIWYFCFATK